MHECCTVPQGSLNSRLPPSSPAKDHQLELRPSSAPPSLDLAAVITPNSGISTLPMHNGAPRLAQEVELRSTSGTRQFFSSPCWRRPHRGLITSRTAVERRGLSCTASSEARNGRVVVHVLVRTWRDVPLPDDWHIQPFNLVHHSTRRTVTASSPTHCTPAQRGCPLPVLQSTCTRQLILAAQRS
jgi:hypothetical protein